MFNLRELFMQFAYRLVDVVQFSIVVLDVVKVNEGEVGLVVVLV